MNEAELTIIRGLPGAGKSTLAYLFSEGGMYPIYEADDFWENREFDHTLLHQAHKECFDNVRTELKEGYTCIVSNTFTTEKELKPYIDLAKELSVRVTVIIVENRHSGKSVHNVPEATIEKMRNRFSVKL